MGSNFATASRQADEWFVTHSLLPWIGKVEQAFNKAVFTSDEFVLSIDVGARLRGDYGAMMAANIQAVRAGVMSADEARIEAGLDPRGGAADELVAQSVGGRPGGTEEGAGATVPPPGRTNGAGRPDGVALN